MKKIEVKCPLCGHEESIDIVDVIEIHQEPGMKERVNSLSLFQYQCSSCQQTIPFIYPLTYHDIEKKLMIRLDPELDLSQPDKIDQFEEAIEKEYGNLEGYTKRWVSDPDSLKEKILIQDLNLDDRVVEIVKAYYIYKAMEQNPKLELLQVLFSKREQKHVFVFIQKDKTMFSTELQQPIYERLAFLYKKRIEELSHEDFMLVDLDWAYKVIDQKH